MICQQHPFNGLQEEELVQAKQLYIANLEEIEQALAADPDNNAELREVKEELQSALQATEDALKDLRPPATAATSLPAATTRQRPPTLSSNNTKIHPRSLYSKSEPDFVALSHHYPSLEQYLIPLSSSNTTSTTRCTIDFTNPHACRELTKALLKVDFGVTWDLPDGHLVPPVTNRLNYILWLEDLMNLSSPSPSGSNIQSIIGIDVGCGASLIYPLLGAALKGWRFVAGDVTKEALEWAGKNLEMNPQLQGLIEVRATKMQQEQAAFFGLEEAEKEEEEEENGGGIITQLVRDGETFAFTMCNPPFFEDMSQSGRNPSTAFGGTAVESIYPGGEEAFVRKMIDDSFRLRNRVYWYSTMVGKKSTLKTVRKWLHAEPAVRAVRTTEFFQGQTSRWAIAWSFAADPAVAMQPLKRDYEDRSGQRQHQSQSSQRKRKKVMGRSMSWLLSVPTAAAAASVLQDIESVLNASNCTKDLQIHIDLANNELKATGTIPLDVAAPFTVTLRAQQPKLYMLSVTIEKGIALNAPLLDWFSEVVAEIEAAAAQNGRKLVQ